MSKLIIVCGPGGVGKTTLAKKLGKRLNIVCFNKDGIKPNLYDVFGYQDLEEAKKADFFRINFFKIYMKLAEEIVANSTDLIMEATFNFEEDCILLKSWKEKYDLDLYCLICENEIEERGRRIKQRGRTGSCLFEK